MLKLKLQYFDHLIQRAEDSLEKTLMLGKIDGRRRRGHQRMRWLDGITDSMDMRLSKHTLNTYLTWSFQKESLYVRHSSDQIRSDQSLSHARLFATP